MLRGLLLCALCAVLCCACASETAPDTEDLTLEQALAELAALPAPEGVGEQRFAELKRSLAEALRNSGRTRFTSVAPDGASGEVGDLVLTVDAGQAVWLEWTYRNKGDYDQNKQVTISDLSALGANLGKGSASPDWLSKAIAADGDANGQVTISDITPIGANLANTVHGYKVQTTDTPGDEESWHDFDEVAFEASAAPVGSALRRFSYNFAPSPSNWYRVVPFDGESRGVPSNAVQYGFGAPDITAVVPLTGEAGTGVTFVPTVAGGSVSVWDWDFGGAATPDTSSLAQPSVTLTTTAGMYAASLTVTNGEGSDTFDFSFEVVNPPAPVIEDVQPQGGTEDESITFVPTLSGGPVATYSWDFGGGAVPNTSSEAEPLVLLPQEGLYSASLTVSNVSGSDTFDFTLDVVTGPNLDPVASFSATPEAGDPGDAVELDASASLDPDGTVVRYEWDLNGDGTFELDGGSNAMANTTLPDPPGAVVVGLRVTDNDAATATASVTLSSLPSGWYAVQADTGGVGEHTALAVVDGRPAVSYQDVANKDLLYAIATDSYGSAWEPPVTVDSAGEVGAFTSLAVIDGHPAISYYESFLGDLKYARAEDPLGEQWGTPVTIQGTGIVGVYTSMLVVNGHPGIAYLDSGNGDLMFVRGTDAQGGGWVSPVTVDSDGFVGSFPSLAIVSDHPAISHCDLVGGELLYIRANDVDGNTWGETEIPATGSNVGMYSSLAVVDGHPAISYTDGSNTSLSFVRAENKAGFEWGEPQLLDNDGINGYYTSLAIVGGMPAISYYDWTNADLKFIRASAADGSAWNAPMVVDSSGEVGKFNSLLEINGLASISYADYTNGALKFAVLLP